MTDHALATDLCQLAFAAPDQRAFRTGALTRVAADVPFDAALFHALNPRVPLTTAVVVGLAPDVVARSVTRWDEYAVELARWRDAALDRGGVAADTEVFSARDRARLGFFRDFARPLGVRSSALVHLQLHGRLIAAVALFRTRGAPGAFTDAELDLLRAAVPALSIADAAHAGAGHHAPLAAAQRRVVCVDDRLTARQREIVTHVALGHTNAETARALGASPNTVRNQLAAVFRVLGAANRAEVVRMAVLR